MDKLRISENGRYFVTADGQPFSWLADTDWTMPQRLAFHDVEYFMKKRKNQGFTVLQIVALDPERDREIRNPIGQKALIDDDLTKPNEKYFEYLDYILDKAEEYGFYVLLLPTWGELVVGHNWTGEFSKKIVTVENAYGYGEWIGNRYKDRKNIMWCLGGDRQPIHLGEDYRPVWRKLAEGLAKGVLGKDLKAQVKDPAWKELPITYHACHEAETGECSTFSYWTEDEAWIGFTMLQSGHGLKPKNYQLVQKEYNARVMPVWDGEPAYEMMPTSWPIVDQFHGTGIVRRRAYWALLAGAFGHTYGHSSVWCSVSEKERSQIAVYTWYESLQSPGSEQIRHLRAFMDDLQPMTYIPAQELLPAENKDAALADHIQCSVSPEKDIILAYLPSGGSVKLKTSDFGWGTANVWWYCTANGKFYTEAETETQMAEQIPMGETLTLTAPSAGEDRDWLLILKKDAGECPIKPGNYYELEEKAADKKVFEW